MSDVSSVEAIGIAARYAAQIRELLALREPGQATPRATGAGNAPDDAAGSQLAPRRAGVDLRA